MRKTLLWMTLVLAGGCAGAQKAAEEGAEAKPGTVAFDFDWPDGMTMEVRHLRDRAIRTDGVMQGWDGSTRFRLVTERQEDGIVVRTEDFAWEGEPAGTLREVLQRAAFTGMPGFVATEVGDLVRLEGVSDILAAYAETSGMDLSRIPDEQRAQIGAQIEQAIQGTSRDLWQNLVGFWAGRELNIGQPVKRRSSTTMPALGNRSVTQYLDYQVLGRVPCDVEVPVPSAQAAAEAAMPEPEPMPEMEPGMEGMEPGMEGMEPGMEGMEPGMEGMEPEEGTDPGLEQGMQAEGEMEAEEEMQPGMESEMAAAEAAPEAEQDARWTPAEEIPGLGEGQCVWIELLSSYDPAAVKEVLDAQTPAPGAPRFNRLANDIRVILVTDPEGLKPHTLVRSQSAEVEVVQPDGTPQVQAEENVHAWMFDYPPASAAAPAE